MCVAFERKMKWETKQFTVCMACTGRSLCKGCSSPKSFRYRKSALPHALPAPSLCPLPWCWLSSFLFLVISNEGRKLTMGRVRWVGASRKHVSHSSFTTPCLDPAEEGWSWGWGQFKDWLMGRRFGVWRSSPYSTIIQCHKLKLTNPEGCLYFKTRGWERWRD